MTGANTGREDSAAPDSFEPLEHCPACDYSLKGLPEHHRCPECGLLCDRYMLVFKGRSNLFEWIIWAGVGLGLLGSLGTAISGRGLRDFLFFLLLIVIPLYLRSMRAMKLILGPGGMTILRNRRAVETTRWEEIRYAEYAPASGGARIVIDPAQSARVVPLVAVGGFHECLRFVKAVNALKERYAPVGKDVTNSNAVRADFGS